MCFINYENSLALLNRPQFPKYDSKENRFYFDTHTRAGRQITITIYNDKKKINYIYKTSIEDLIRHADQVIREVESSFSKKKSMNIFV